MVPGANLEIEKKTLIFQGLSLFPVSHSSKMSPICLPNFKGDKWETGLLQYFLHLAGDDLHGHILHLWAVLDIAERRVIVGVSGTCHDVIGGCL